MFSDFNTTQWGKKRYLLSFGSSAIVYLVGSIFLWYSGSIFVMQKGDDLATKRVSVALSQFVSDEAPCEPSKEEASIVKPTVPVVKEKIIEKQVVKEKEVQKQKPTQKQNKQVTTKQQPSAKIVTEEKQPNAVGKPTQFDRIGELKSRIDRNKFYPTIAKNRGIQGSIKAEIEILSNGKMGRVNLEGPKIFHNAAKEAIAKSFPLDTNGCKQKLPVTIHVVINYKLTET